ncbi:MAG: NADH-quinone oxidoreductase subunit C [Spirochaetales bacterium]|nr:NADH-quinone oxidoreductase subunit C [Spirochaetales bacterium]
MNGTILKNGKPVGLKDIPVLPIGEFEDRVKAEALDGLRVVAFFGAAGGRDAVNLYCVLADDENSRLAAFATLFAGDRTYRSFTPDFPAFHLFEREAYEEYGLLPEGHPALKPVRNIFPAGSDGEVYPFDRVEGEEVHEVGVGPIHAGVIEPGRFRFSCLGETVHRLDIHLGYQRRGAERLFLRPGAPPEALLLLAETVAGDECLGHGLAFAQAWEGLGGADCPLRALAVRGLALELERAAMHIGDLAALSGDIAYLPGQAGLGATRTIVINTLLEICGSRFGRGLLAVGGVNYGLDGDIAARVRANVDAAEDAADRLCGLLFSSASVLSRFESTGTVSPQTARALGMVGPAARASGLSLDVRADHPAGPYASFPVHRLTLKTGDVFARAYIRRLEITQSFNFIRGLLDGLPAAGDLVAPPRPLRPEAFVVSLVESWRGETVHAALTDASGRLARYKIVDASFHNWSGLEQAVRGNGISDFPLCNKSFNLSYCGFDL